MTRHPDESAAGIDAAEDRAGLATQDESGWDAADADGGDDGGLVITALAGIAAVGVSMAARPVLNAVYRRVTGHQPPRAEDPSVPFTRALAWTIVSATTGAVLELIVQRSTRRLFGVRG